MYGQMSYQNISPRKTTKNLRRESKFKEIGFEPTTKSSKSRTTTYIIGQLIQFTWTTDKEAEIKMPFRFVNVTIEGDNLPTQNILLCTLQRVKILDV